MAPILNVYNVALYPANPTLELDATCQMQQQDLIERLKFSPTFTPIDSLLEVEVIISIKVFL